MSGCSRWIIGVLVAACALGTAVVAQEAGRLSEEQRARISERDRLVTSFHELLAAGRFAEAIAAAERSLQIEREVRGAEHCETLATAQWLVRLKASTGDFAAARELAKSTLATQQRGRADGDWRVTTAKRLVALVEQYQRLDEVQRASLREAEQQLRAGVRLAGEYKFKEALPLFTKSLEIRKAVLGEENPEYLTSLSHVGWCYCEMEDFEQAEPRLRAVLAQRQKVLGADHPDCALSHNLLGWLYLARKQFSEAEGLFRRAAETYRSAQGELGSEYEESLDNLSELYVRTRNFRRAEALRQQTVEIRKAAAGEKHPSYAKRLMSLSFVYQYLGEFDKAEPILVQALEVFQQAGGEESRDTIECLENLSYVYQNANKPREALKIEERLLAQRRKSLGNEHVEVAQKLFRIGSIYVTLKDWPQALRYAREEASISRKTAGEKHPGTMASLRNIAWLLGVIANEARQRGDFATAKANRSEEIELCTQVYGKDHWQVVERRLALEYTELAEKLPIERRRELQEGEEADIETERLRETDPRGALAAAEKALAIHRKILGEEHWVTVESLANVGFFYKERGDYQLARPIYLRLPELVKKSRGEISPKHYTHLHNLGVLYLETGELQEAKDTLDLALTIGKQAHGGERYGYVRTVNSLAVVHDELGDIAAAEGRYRESLEIRREELSEKHVDYGDGLLQLGAFYFWTLNDLAKAEPLFKEAVAVYRAAVGDKHPSYARGIDFLASLYVNSRRYELAEPLYREALAVREAVLGADSPEVATSLHNLGTMYADQGRFGEAEGLLKRAVEIKRRNAERPHPGTFKTLNELAHACAGQGKFREAHEWQRQSVAHSERFFGDHHANYAESLSRLAASHARIGDAKQGVPMAKKALQIAYQEMQRSALVRSERQQLSLRHVLWSHVDRFVDVTGLANSPADETYGEVLRWKGIVGARQEAVRQLHHQLRSSGNPQAVKLQRELDEAVRTLATLSRGNATADRERRFRVEEVSDKIEALQAELTKYSAGLQQEAERRGCTPADIRRVLPADAALVDFVAYETFRATEPPDQTPIWRQMLTAFVVRPGRATERIEFGPTDVVTKAIETWRLGFGSPSSGSDPGRDLRKLVWEPIEGKLVGAKTVLISPNGATAPVPWAALPGSKAGSFLIEDVAIAVVPMASLLPEVLAGDARAAEGSSLLLVGDVDFGGELSSAGSSGADRAAIRGDEFYNWTQLPGTRAEVAAIKEAFAKRAGAPPAVELTGAGATKSAVRAEASRHAYLHISTHGFFSPAKAGGPSSSKAPLNPSAADEASGLHPDLLSGLVLTGANRRSEAGQEDGILTALEVREMDLRNVKLATLSACETGLGKAEGGEGFLGLQRAFQIAGAKALVSSLWKVDDAATQMLMAELYRNLWEKKLGKLEALRQAQLWMLREGVKQPELRRGLAARGLKEAEGTGDRGQGTENMLPPYYWGAWVLSGDWR